MNDVSASDSGCVRGAKETEVTSRQPPVPKTRSEERALSLSPWTPLTLAKIRREAEVRVGRASVVETVMP